MADVVVSAVYAKSDNSAVTMTLADGHKAYVDLSLDNPNRATYNAWLAHGNTPAAYSAPPAPVPETISDRQFFQALALSNFITQDEALAAVQTGTIPGGMMPLINSLPSEQQFSAKMLLAGATQFNRHHPLTTAFMAANGVSDAMADDLWRMASTL